MHQTYTNNVSQQPVQITYHNNLSHQYYQQNHIYSPRSITKKNIKDVHQPATSKFGSFCDEYFDALATLCHGICDKSGLFEMSFCVTGNFNEID
jgi:hypothetical protein